MMCIDKKGPIDNIMQYTLFLQVPHDCIEYLLRNRVLDDDFTRHRNDCRINNILYLSPIIKDFIQHLIWICAFIVYYQTIYPVVIRDRMPYRNDGMCFSLTFIRPPRQIVRIIDS